MSSKKWAVILIDTNNGKRVGIMEQDGIDGLEIIINDLYYATALRKSKEYAREMGIVEFDNVVDVPLL